MRKLNTSMRSEERIWHQKSKQANEECKRTKYHRPINVRNSYTALSNNYESQRSPFSSQRAEICRLAKKQDQSICMKDKHTLLAMTNTAAEKKDSNRYPKHMEHIFIEHWHTQLHKNKTKKPLLGVKIPPDLNIILVDDLSKPLLAIDRSYRNPPKIGGK